MPCIIRLLRFHSKFVGALARTFILYYLLRHAGQRGKGHQKNFFSCERLRGNPGRSKETPFFKERGRKSPSIILPIMCLCSLCALPFVEHYF